jgi:hypothetical protein
LQGNKFTPDIITDYDIDTGNKVLVNTGLLSLYGKFPAFVGSKLAKTAR